jgi:hypothetical protein
MPPIVSDGCAAIGASPDATNIGRSDTHNQRPIFIALPRELLISGQRGP